MDVLSSLPETARGTDTDADAQADARLLDTIARELVRRRLTTPAILFLESVKPLNFIGSQALHFLDPIVRLFVTVPEYSRLARLLEERDSIERLVTRIEAFEDAAERGLES